jgi:hypothetical protein
MFLAMVFAPTSEFMYLQGARQAFTLKSLRRTSQYIPHYSGLDGTNMNRLQTHFWQAVFCFFPKRALLCSGNG